MPELEVMIDSDGWVLCPYCRSKSKTKIRKDTVIKNFPLFCPKCKREVLIDIDQSYIGLSVERDAETQSR